MSDTKKDKTPQLTEAQAKEKLWRLGNLEWKLRGVQKNMRQAVYNSSGKKNVFLCARRLGKCLVEGTEVITTKGMKNIEDVQIGDVVYGYNKDGSVSPTKVQNVVDQGEKEVVELINGGKVIAECTLDHPWMAYNVYTKKTQQVTTRELLANNKRLKIKREFVQSPCGDFHEPHAYAIGALLGDGCSREGVNAIHISSESDVIPSKVASQLGCGFYKQKANNHTWVISHNKKLDYRGQKREGHINYPPDCHHYTQWCKGRYAHEKIADLDIIKTWDRESCLQFMAGLIDSDGSVGFRNNRLIIQFSCQSKSMVDAFGFLFYQLFQYKPNIIVDDRDKYKNGPCYAISIGNNLFSKIALKELSPYLQVERKKWKPEYEDAPENNTNREFIGVKRGNTRKVQTWDLSIANQTKLYLLANGTVTHNTFVMMLLAVEQCIKQKNSIVKVLFPKKKDAKDVARFQMREILNDCPQDLLPLWKEADKMFVFPNGSEIQMAGTDAGNAESIRGSACHLAILDESGFHDYNDFTYIVQSIVMPTLLTTKGKMILASTPSREPDHPFMIDYVLPARKEGSLLEYDIYSNPMITEQDIEEMADEFPGGVEDPDFQREYMLKSDVVSSEFVVPEFDQKLKQDILIQASEKPAYYDSYTSGDPAATDLTVILFAYYDYLNGQIVICDELILGGEGEIITTIDIADGIRRKEKLNFSNPLTGEVRKPYLRVMDNNNKILINDLNMEHGLEFIPTAKDNKEAQINKLRMMLKQGKILIDKKCKTLIYHLEVARWAKNKREFQRLKGDRSRDMKPHHCDAVDALVYLVRNVYFEKNPYPDDFFELKGEGIHYPQSYNKLDDKAKQIMYGIVGKKKTK